MSQNKDLTKFRKKVREAFSDYTYSEGCRCCEGYDHDDHRDILAELLNFPKNKNGSYDFYKYAKSKIEKET